MTDFLLSPMPRHARHALATTILIAATLLSSNHARSQPFTEIVVFGDSDSDVGHGPPRFGIPASPPYFNGRFSNGPVWVERLAELLEVPNPRPSASELGGTNYAWGGATTGSIDGFPLPDMDEQVRSFLSEHMPRNDQLFLLLGGGADVFFGQSDMGAMVKSLSQQISDLASAGARHFLVGNMREPLHEGEAVYFAPANEFNKLLPFRSWTGRRRHMMIHPGETHEMALVTVTPTTCSS